MLQTLLTIFQPYLICCFLERDSFSEGQGGIVSYRLVQITLEIEFYPQWITWSRDQKRVYRQVSEQDWHVTAG